jgi:hypothetical protein
VLPCAHGPAASCISDRPNGPMNGPVDACSDTAPSDHTARRIGASPAPWGCTCGTNPPATYRCASAAANNESPPASPCPLCQPPPDERGGRTAPSSSWIAGAATSSPGNRTAPAGTSRVGHPPSRRRSSSLPDEAPADRPASARPSLAAPPGLPSLSDRAPSPHRHTFQTADAATSSASTDRRPRAKTDGPTGD